MVKSAKCIKLNNDYQHILIVEYLQILYMVTVQFVLDISEVICYNHQRINC